MTRGNSNGVREQNLRGFRAALLGGLGFIIQGVLGLLYLSLLSSEPPGNTWKEGAAQEGVAMRFRVRA